MMILVLPLVSVIVPTPPEVSAYTPHGRITIVGNADFTPANGVTGGAGTWDDPYVIEGWEIDASTGNGITIGGTNAHFVIRNVYVHSGAAYRGIALFDLANGAVENSTASNNQDGVYVEGSTKVNITSNNASGNLQDGIHLFGSRSVNITSNTVSNNPGGAGGQGGIHVDGVVWVGIISDHVNITSNSITYNRMGIYVESSHDVNIASNDISRNSRDGIGSVYFDNASIVSNVVSGNLGSGISLHTSANASIAHNAIHGNPMYGILLNLIDNNPYSTSDITSNEVSGSGDGITILTNYPGITTKANIISNIVHNVSSNGINLFSTNANIISNRVSNTSGWGVFLDSSTEGNVTSNAVSGNALGGVRICHAANVTIVRNNITENLGFGLRLESNTNTSTHHNNIVNNANQAYDDRGLENAWDDGYPSGGNLWGDYAGPDLFSGPGQDIPGSDGIGDVPYVIDANSSDRYPLTELPGITPGHHFMSFPVIVANDSIESVLSSMSGCYDYVRWFDSLDVTSPWKSYVPGRGANSLLRLDNTMGFWINVTSTCGLVVPGVRPSTTSILLHQGWNMVGFPSFNMTYRVSDLKADLGLPGVIVETFDPNAAPYYLQRVDDDVVMRTGEGYWIFVPSDTVWIVNG